MFQFNVRDFMWRVLELSGLLAFLGYFGFKEPVAYLALIYIALVTVTFWLRFSKEYLNLGVLLLGAVGLATLGVLYLSVLSIFSMIFALVYAIVLGLLGTYDIGSSNKQINHVPSDDFLRQRWRGRSAILAAMIIAAIVCSLVPNPRLLEIQRDRVKYPVLELTVNDRGEKRPSKLEIAKQASGITIDPDLARGPSGEVDDNSWQPKIRDPFLGYWSKNHNYSPVDSQINYYRQAQRFRLRNVHDREHEAFVRRNGFGVTRMMSYYGSEVVAFPEFQPVELSQEHERRQSNPNWLLDGADASHLPREVIHEMHQEAEQSADQFHRISLLEFVDPRGWGWPKDFRQVAGFSAHGLRHPPLETVHQSEALLLRSLQLISLERFDEPRAYEVENVPQMVELSSATVPTRSLNDFESRALTQLMDQTAGAGDLTVIIEERDREILMLGAVPAAVSCFDCHASSTRGLLGAFSYVFEKMETGDVEKLPVSLTK